MPDPRFHARSGPFALSRLAQMTGAEARPGTSGPDQVLSDVAPLDAASPEHLSFLDNRKYAPALDSTGAGAVILRPEMASRAPDGVALLVTNSPYRAYALAAAAFYPEPVLEATVHPRALIDPEATIGEGCRVEANAVIGARAVIGAGCQIGANVVIGEGVEIGEGTRVGANATLSHCLIGRSVLIHPGVRIGQRGFGFATDEAGFIKVPQLGRVIVEDHVELGANMTIDRGAGPDTVIGAGSMIDNLVQIGHNVRLGRNCVLVAQVGIAGSSILEDQVVIAGQGGISGHVRIGRGARIAAKAGVISDIPAGATYAGIPAVPHRQWLRQSAHLRRLVGAKQDKD